MNEVEAKESPGLTIFFALGLLTAVELGVASLGMLRLAAVVVLILLALWKALLVALYYLHLLFDSRRLWLLAAAPLPLALGVLLAVLTERW